LVFFQRESHFIFGLTKNEITNSKIGDVCMFDGANN